MSYRCPYCGSIVDKRTYLIADIKHRLVPEWLFNDAIVMYDPKQHAIVISPSNALRHGITNIQVAHNRMGSRTILRFRLDFNTIDKKYMEYIKSEGDTYEV